MVEVFIDDGELWIRRAEEGDAPILSRWLSDPRVLEWWGGRDDPQDEEGALEWYVRGRPYKCIIDFEGRPVGYQQFYELDDEQRAEYGTPEGEPTWGMDQFIGEVDLWSSGIGTRLVEAVTAYLFDERGAERVVMDPMQHNLRALRCYEKAGYSRVKALPAHEMHEGAMRDCWLIERVPPADA